MDLLPLAIQYGMSVKEFWEESPDLFWAYRFSYIQKVKQEQAIANTPMWLQGAYIYEAVSVALSNAFSKVKHNYSQQPYDLNTSKEDKAKQLQMQLKNRVMKVQEVFGGEKKNGNRTE